MNDGDLKPDKARECRSLVEPRICHRRSGQQRGAEEAQEEAQEGEAEKHKKNSPFSLCLSLPPQIISNPAPGTRGSPALRPPLTLGSRAAGLAAPGRRHALSLANGRVLIAGPYQQAAHLSLSPASHPTEIRLKPTSTPPPQEEGKGREAG